MNKIDEKIRAALAEEDKAAFDALGEPSLFEMVADTFSGRLRWLNWLMGVMIAAYTVLGLFCAYQFFQVSDTKSLIAWSVGFLFCGLAVLMMKQWTWMQMDRHALTREIKRLELQIATLAGSLKTDK